MRTIFFSVKALMTGWGLRNKPARFGAAMKRVIAGWLCRWDEERTRSVSRVGRVFRKMTGINEGSASEARPHGRPACMPRGTCHQPSARRNPIDTGSRKPIHSSRGEKRLAALDVDSPTNPRRPHMNHHLPLPRRRSRFMYHMNDMIRVVRARNVTLRVGDFGVGFLEDSKIWMFKNFCWVVVGFVLGRCWLDCDWHSCEIWAGGQVKSLVIRLCSCWWWWKTLR